MDPTPLTHQLRMDSSDSSCSNRTRSIASLGGSEDSILEERVVHHRSNRGGSKRQFSDGFSPDEQDSGFNSNTQLESTSPYNGSLRCRTPEIKSPKSQEDSSDEVWLPRFPRARKLGADRTLGTSGSLGSTDSWIENSVSEEEEDVDEGDMARCLTSLCMGSGVIKVKGSGRCAVKTLYLDTSRSCVRWRPSKKGTKAKIIIESIKEVREGPNTDTFKKYLVTGSKCHPRSCLSIIHGSSWETFDLILETEEELGLWIKGLKHLMKGVRSEVRRLNSNNKLRDSWLKATFEAADKSGDGLLSMDEVLKLLHKLNVSLSKRKVKQLFKEADSQDENIGKLDFEEFIHFYRTISNRNEVDLLLRDYGHGKGHMTLEEFARFLSDEQGMTDVELDLCQELVQMYEPIPENSKNGWMGIDGFTRYLLSHEGDIFNPAHREVNQDMTRPLTHYYIASSHNTYLVGDQLMSQSSVDVYALVLQAGCRCVEMDCWDGKDGEPVIYHGYTLTSKIKFRDVISIVSKYAFVTSPYPIILSIENHCSLEQQKKMAQYLVEILGDMLHIPSLSPAGAFLPSPEELKGKILIKAKKLPGDHNENLEAGEVSEEDSADELDDDLKLERSSISKKFESVAMAQLMLMRKKPIMPTQSAWKRIISKVREDSRSKDADSRNHAKTSSLTGTLRRLKLSKKKPKSQSSSESSESGSFDLLEKSATDDEFAGDQSSCSSPKTQSPHSHRPYKGKSIVLCRQLSQLVQLTRSVGFRGFKSAMLSWELPSLGEMRASNLVATKAPDFVQFTTNHLCRVYPSAYRIDSSNYNPQPMWNCGCQLVALNYQTEGRPMQLSRAKFSRNGNCGYMLKHPLLCNESKPFDPNSGDPVPHLAKKQLTIHIISGQQLPKPPQSLLGERGEIIDPYVEVEVIGLPVDCAKGQTKTIQDNGFSPFWDSTMTFTLHMPEMALIRFAVWDEDPIGRDFIGQATLPVTSLMQGYRHVHLDGLDQATIFVYVIVEDYNTWVNNTARFRPRGSQCRTKSVELEYSPLSSSPTHRHSPRRKSSLGLVQKLNMRRRHSMAALPPRELSPLPTGTRIKRRSYEEGHMTGSAGELRTGDEAIEPKFELYFELAFSDTDTAVDLILDSAVPSELEADGTFCISVDDLPEVLELNIPTPVLLEAVQEQKISLRSENSYTSVERSLMADLLTQEEIQHSLANCETESFVDTDSYEQFIQDVFEECLRPELSYDPCPDLLKEASPLSQERDNQSSCLNESSPKRTSTMEISTNIIQESSDEDTDEVFLPNASVQSNPVIHSPDTAPPKKASRPPPLQIPTLNSNLSPTCSTSSSLSSPLLTPTSSPCTFVRDTVERRSRIIYDDTDEFLKPSLDASASTTSDDCHKTTQEGPSVTSSNDNSSGSPAPNNKNLNSGVSVSKPDCISNMRAKLNHFSPKDENSNTSDDNHTCKAESNSFSPDHASQNVDNKACSNSSETSRHVKESSTEKNLAKTSLQGSEKITHPLDNAQAKTLKASDKTYLKSPAQPPVVQECNSEQLNIHPKQPSDNSSPVTFKDKNNNARLLSHPIEPRLPKPDHKVSLENVKSSQCLYPGSRGPVKQPLWVGDETDSEDEESEDSNEDDSSSCSSSTSVPSSTSSSDTVVEVPSFASMPSGSQSSNNTVDLSPLKLEDIFDPGECQQFRSELVQRWQNAHKDNLVPESRSHSLNSRRLNTSTSRESSVNFTEGMDSSIVQIVSDRRSRVSSQHEKDKSHKRLSWPLQSSGKKFTVDKVSDLQRWKIKSRESISRGEEMGSEMDDRCMPDLEGRDENIYKKPRTTIRNEVEKGHHPPNQTKVVFRSHLSQVKLSNQSQEHVCKLNHQSTCFPDNGVGHTPPSYHDHLEAYKKSNSLPSNLDGSLATTIPPKHPPSYEDHISKYGMPSKFQPTLPNETHKQVAPSLRLWRAEPVTISQVRTIQLHSAKDICHMKQNRASSEHENVVSKSGHGGVSYPGVLHQIPEKNTGPNQTSTPVSNKQNVDAGSSSGNSVFRPVQFHPTPPRNRKRLLRSFSDEGPMVINDRLSRRDKKWSANSGKNQNIYLMLTL